MGNPWREPELMAVGAEYEAVGMCVQAGFKSAAMHPSLNYHNADRGSNTISCITSHPHQEVYSHDPKTLVPSCDFGLVESGIITTCAVNWCPASTNLRHRPFLGSEGFNSHRIHASAGSLSHFDSSDAGGIQSLDKGTCL